MLKRTLTVTVCLVAICTSAFGETMVVRLRNGREHTGRVEKTPAGDEYRITRYYNGRPGVTITVKVSDVVEMKKVLSFTDMYAEKLKGIDPNSAEEHLAVAKWADGKGQLKVAIYELEVALKLKPSYERAQLLLKQYKARDIKRPPGNGGGIKPPDDRVTRPREDRKGMVTAADVNRIRLGELADGKFVRKAFLGGTIEYRALEPVRMVFSKNVVGRFVDAMRNDDDFRVDPKRAGEAFKKWSDQDRLAYMLSRLDRGDWGMKDDITIRTDPKSIKVFRRTIWPVLTKTCGSAKCHGAPKGQGKLKLYNVKSTDTLGVYSNFLILNMFTKGGKMLNRDFPRESLLGEAGLPTKEAKWKHPSKAKATPTFRSVNDTRYKALLAWIESLKGPPTPYYGVTYAPPFGPDPDASDALRSNKKSSALP